MKKLPQQKDMSELILRLLLTSAAVISIEGSPRTFVDESLVNNITQYPKLVDNDILIKTKQEAQHFFLVFGFWSLVNIIINTISQIS